MSNIPEWCKKAAEEYLSETEDWHTEYATNQLAETISKHAPEAERWIPVTERMPEVGQMQRELSDLREQIATMTRNYAELIKAAEDSLEDSTTAVQVHARIRLRAALAHAEGKDGK